MNNYNCNSEFEDIELNVSYDYDLGQWEFRENFEKISNGFRQAPVLLFTDCGNFSEDVSCVLDCYDFTFCTYKDYRRVCLELCRGLTTRETISEKRCSSDSWEMFFFQTLEEQTDLYTCCRDGFPNVDNAKELYKVIYVTGYSQGDCAYILVPEKCMFDGIQQYLQHLVFDAPIYARVTIDDEETDLLELAGLDLYDWNRVKVAEAVEQMAISEKAKKWIIENLPEYPAE